MILKKLLQRYCLTSSLLLVLLCIASTASAATFNLPKDGDDIVGKLLTIQIKKGESWDSLGKKYDLSWYELIEANQDLDPNKVLEHQKVLIPAQHILPRYRHGIVINMSELRLYYFTKDGKQVKTFPVTLGRRKWRTPIGKTYIVKKQANPDWHVPKTIRDYAKNERKLELPNVIKAGDPKNPLGRFAIYLGKKGYVIHGTNQPWTIGHFISSGCIRMRDGDIDEVFKLAERGVPVHIVNNPVKAGWLDGKLYLKAQLPLILNEVVSDDNHDSGDRAVKLATKDRPVTLYSRQVKAVTVQRKGIPKLVGVAKLDAPADTVVKDKADKMTKNQVCKLNKKA